MRPGLAPSFKIVSKHVARNPVARAVMRAEQHRAATEYQVYLHGLADGDDAAGDVVAAGSVLLVARHCAMAMGEPAAAHASTIRGAIGALRDIAATGYVWRTRHIAAVDMGMHRATEVYDAAPAQLVQDAYYAVTAAIERSGLEAAQAEAVQPPELTTSNHNATSTTP